MKKPWNSLAFAVVLLVVLSFAFTGCGNGEGDDALLGVWSDPAGVVEFEFKSDGTLLVRMMGEEEQTTYSVEDGKLSAIDLDTGEPSEVDYSIEGDTLILGVDGEEGTLVRKE